MDNVAVSRRNHVNKKANKENAQPACGGKSLIRREKTAVNCFQLTNNKKEETVAKNGPLKAKVDTRPASGEALIKVQKDVRGAAADVKPRQTHSRAFLAEQAVRHKKIVAEAPKPPAAAPASKPAPGMYKGKIVQSKIGSIWKSTDTAGGADPKPAASKTEGQRIRTVTKSRSKSVTDPSGYGTQKPAPIRSKSVARPAQESKPAATSHPPAGFRSARPPTRTVPATLTSTTSSRYTKAAPTKGSGTQNSKPKIPVTEKKVNKPPVTSTLSQYRLTMETAEERRAKLAEWLASKGKTFKRPAMTTAEPSRTKVSAKLVADPDPQPPSHVEPQPTAQSEPEPRLEAHKPDAAAAAAAAAAALCADTQQAATHSQTPMIMNTTLDLLENSDADPQGSVEDIVVNLCDALEAMVTTSGYDELSPATDVCSDVESKDSKPKYECKEEELKMEVPDDVDDDDACMQQKVEQVKDEAEESHDQKVETDEEIESDDEKCVMAKTPPMEDASVIKYSVKTTPYLQSVKKTMEGEANICSSRRKSNIKDLKFLTPVRRSSRIKRISSRLPAMLVDPDPCVSSLAELVKLDDDPTAYIYRKNQALLEDLPDQSKP